MDIKKTLSIVVGIAVVGAAGWFAWDFFMADEPPPPPVKTAKKAGASKGAAPKGDAKAPEQAAAKSAEKASGAEKGAPAAAKAAGPADANVNADKLIDDVMTASGLKKQLTQLPEQILSGMKQAGQQRKQALPFEAADMEKIVAESFSAQNFQSRAAAQLKGNFDAKRMQALLADLSSEAAKKMTAMETAPSSQEELTAFSKGLAAKPLPAPRAELIRRLDAASKASDFSAEIFFSTARALAMGAAGDNPQKTVEIDQAIEKQRAALTENLRKATVASLAFAYRNASDAELDAYTKIYESENGKWFTGIASAAINEEFKSAANKAGERIAALVEEKKKTKLASGAAKGQPKAEAKAEAKAEGKTEAKAAEKSAAAAESKSAPRLVSAARPLNPAKKSEDARGCLGQNANNDIIKCAEDYR